MSLSRATLPQEFYDVTSDMLLLQPEPQYLHGALLKAAMAASLSQSSDVGLPGRLIGGSGASYGTPDQHRLMMEQRALASEAVQFVSELGKGVGHTVRINRPQFADTTYTQASRLVATGATISTTPIDVASEQTAITLQRFAGPYDSTNSRVAPLAVEKFDAGMALHKLVEIRGFHLKRDFDKFMDAVGVALFGTTSSTIRPNGFTADNDHTVAGSGPMDWDTLTRVEQSLDEGNVPRFSNGNRICVLHPRQIQQLKNDPDFMKQAVFHKDKNPLFQSYVATAGNLDIYVSNTLATASNGSSVTVYRGQCFGPGMVGCGMGRKPEVVSSTADNYGELSLVVWLMYAGFVTLDNRFGRTITTG
jgi:hypothetical protein